MGEFVIGSFVESSKSRGYAVAMNPEFAPLLKLGLAERLQLVEDLWDSIALEATDLPVAPWKSAELRRRKEELSKNANSARTWDQVKERALQA